MYTHTDIYMCVYMYFFFYIWNICFSPIHLGKRKGALCSKDICFAEMLVKRENAKTEAQYVLTT